MKRKIWKTMVAIFFCGYTFALGQELSPVDATRTREAVRNFYREAFKTELSQDIKLRELKSGLIEALVGDDMCIVDLDSASVGSWLSLPSIPKTEAKSLSKSDAEARARAWLYWLGQLPQGSVDSILTKDSWIIGFPVLIDGFETPLRVSVTMDRATGKVWSMRRFRTDVQPERTTNSISLEVAEEKLKARLMEKVGRVPDQIRFQKTLYSFGGPSSIEGTSSSALLAERKLRLAHKFEVEQGSKMYTVLVDAEDGRIIGDGLSKSSPSAAHSNGATTKVEEEAILTGPARNWISNSVLLGVSTFFLGVLAALLFRKRLRAG